MLLKKLGKTLLVTGALAIPVLLLSSCNTIPIQDEKITGSLGAAGGVTYDLFTNEKTVLTLPQVIAKWTDTSNPQCMMGVDALGDFKLEIEELCTLTACTEQQQKVQANAINIINNLQGIKSTNTAPYNSKAGH
jgi:hypothetical protein